MTWVGTGVAVGGAVLGGMSKSDAADDAAEMFEEGLKEYKIQAGEARGKLNAGYNEQSKMAKPWMEAGTQALTQMQAGIAEGSFSPGEFSFNFEEFKNDPSYQFRFDETMRMMEQGGAARGKRLSGEQLKALQDRGGNLASQEYQNAFGRAANTWQMNRAEGQDRYNQLAGVAGMGQGVTSQMIGERGNLARGLADTHMRTGGAAMGAFGGMADAEMAGGAAEAEMYGGISQSVNQGIANKTYDNRYKNYLSGMNASDTAPQPPMQ